MTPNNFVLFSMLLLSFLAVHDALKCYRCNSNENPECFNVRPLPALARSPRLANLTSPNTTATPTTTVAPTNSSKRPSDSPLFLEECGPDDKGRQPFCRKMVYTVLNNKHHRVVRECGYERSEKDCYMADNDDHLEMVCQCWTDGCNGAERINSGTVIVAITMVVGVLLRLLAI